MRATGIVEAVRSVTVLTPSITGQNGRMTLVSIVPNGVRVKKGDTLAEFDRTQQEDAARDTEGKFDDLTHKVEQRAAQNRADGERRRSDLSRAEADLEKADLELRKGPVLMEIERLKNESKKRDAQARVASLKRSHKAHDAAEAAALRILELQRDRQKVALDRAKTNLEKLVVRAPLDGMVALESVWRNNSMGHAQEGDQLWLGEPLVRIFDASEMRVRTQVGEPDGACLLPGTLAHVRLDAYPELVLAARYESASPIAASALGSPVKAFSARFRLESRDARVLPDLSAAIMIELPAEGL
ncbi:MAG: efflux RND transporter periplasmic adaptor subunit [Acidobacteria bacterium]|nr:efflux RND transporter periplasmic adaptor subunit [Acidobacteriota bacterium]